MKKPYKCKVCNKRTDILYRHESEPLNLESCYKCFDKRLTFNENKPQSGRLIPKSTKQG